MTMSSPIFRPVPAPGRLIVRIVEPPSEGAFGIVLVKLREHSPVCGQVTAVGGKYWIDGDEFNPLYAVGEYVIFGQYSGTELSIGRDRVLILRETDVQARLVLAIEGTDGELTIADPTTIEGKQ